MSAGGVVGSPLFITTVIRTCTVLPNQSTSLDLPCVEERRDGYHEDIRWGMLVCDGQLDVNLIMCFLW